MTQERRMNFDANCSTCLLRVLNSFNSLNELCVAATAAGVRPARPNVATMPKCCSALTHNWSHNEFRINQFLMRTFWMKRVIGLFNWLFLFLFLFTGRNIKMHRRGKTHTHTRSHKQTHTQSDTEEALRLKHKPEEALTPPTHTWTACLSPYLGFCLLVSIFVQTFLTGFTVCLTVCVCGFGVTLFGCCFVTGILALVFCWQTVYQNFKPLWHLSQSITSQFCLNLLTVPRQMNKIFSKL